MTGAVDPVVAEDDARLLGVVGITLLVLAEDASLWRDYKALIDRAQVLADANVRRGRGGAR